MIIIKEIKRTAPMMYLWLKSVKSVNLSIHCARCLVGTYNENVNKDIEKVENIELEDGIYYLCGVAKPYNWNKNFHLAFQYKEGENIVYENNGISVIINNAIALPISEQYIDKTNKYADRPEYYTCRNWQFAHYYQKELKETKNG